MIYYTNYLILDRISGIFYQEYPYSEDLYTASTYRKGILWATTTTATHLVIF